MACEELETRIQALEEQQDAFNAQVLEILQQNRRLADESQELTRQFLVLTDPWRSLKHLMRRLLWPF